MTESHTFIPSDELLMDYLDGRTAPEVSRQITTYLTAHPHKKIELEDWRNLIAAYEDMPLSSPSSRAIDNVLATAREFNQVPASSSWIEKFIVNFRRREIVLATVLVALVGLNFVTRQFEVMPTKSRVADLTPPAKAPVTANLTAALPEATTETKAAPTLQSLDEATLAELNMTFDRGVDAYKAGDYARANALFTDVIAKHPKFEKRLELYPYWVAALKNLGQHELAQKKLDLFERLKAKSNR